MDFGWDARTEELRESLLDLMETRVHPAEAVFAREMTELDDPWAWSRVPVLQSLRAEARERGLWNAFMPGPAGAGLTNLQYAPLAEITGRAIQLAPAALNCAAPDTGNMEVLDQFGSDAQKARVAGTLAAGRDPIRVRDDRTRRGLLRRDQHRHPHRARRRLLRRDRPQVVDHRGDEPRLRRLHRHGQDRPVGRASPAAEHGPRAAGHAGADGGPADVGHGLRRPRPRRPRRARARRGPGARGEPHRRRGGRVRHRAGPARARAGSTTACAPSAWRSGPSS